MRVSQLKKLLNALPNDMEIYLSSDEEGNNYGKTDIKFGTAVYEEDNALILYPSGRFDFDEIAPKTYAKEEE